MTPGRSSKSDLLRAHYVTVNPATAVTFRTLWATRSAKGILLRWSTASELDALGFNVYRATTGPRAKLNRSLIGTNGGGFYSFLDRKAPRGTTLRYWFQVMDLDGSTSWYGPTTACR